MDQFFHWQTIVNRRESLEAHKKNINPSDQPMINAVKMELRNLERIYKEKFGHFNAPDGFDVYHKGGSIPSDIPPSPIEDMADLDKDIWDDTPTETVPSIYEAKTVKKGEYLVISFLTAGWPLTIENGAKVKIGTALNGAKIMLLGDNAKAKIGNDLGADVQRNY